MKGLTLTDEQLATAIVGAIRETLGSYADFLDVTNVKFCDAAGNQLAVDTVRLSLAPRRRPAPVQKGKLRLATSDGIDVV